MAKTREAGGERCQRTDDAPVREEGRADLRQRESRNAEPPPIPKRVEFSRGHLRKRTYG